MKKRVSILVIALLVAGVNIFAQYPKITPEVEAQSEALLKKANDASDIAWAKALPIIEKEAKEGRPYVPWAAVPSDLVHAKIPAFPGAEGGGAFSPGGRGGKVIVVTNLEDSGPGSLREACEQGGARIVVFNVAGIIRLKTPLIVRAPYITIAGQTAPGDGICIAGETLWVNTHDFVVRHVRFRRGETWVGRRDDSFGGNPVGNIMIDHCSTSWGLDENISFYRHMYDPKDGTKARKLPTVNVTIQNTISAQALDTYNHSFGSTIGGENCTFMRNLWADNAGRNPSIGMGAQFNLINNVFYNWVHRTTDGGGGRTVFNIVNNYYKPGPLTPKNSSSGHRIAKAESGGSNPGNPTFSKVYAHGNIMEGYPEITADNWNGGVQIRDQHNTDGYTEKMKLTEPLPVDNPFPILSAQDAYHFVLANVGANFPKRDIVDERIIKQVRTGEVYYDKEADKIDFYQFEHRRLPKDSYKQGIITDIRQVGGYPEYKGTPYKDSDNDGIPDAWEKKYGLNPNDPADAVKDLNGDGYTNIEKYINGIDPTKKTDWTKPENNHDTLVGKKSLF
ncbi:hypothetical protein AGMMS50239_10960 [Bacteroidia bacterium]|nr:hypothetical protein AGMMS50239_10960 [Bacteroidia bacterium]